MKTSKCANCGTEHSRQGDFCTWECRVAQARLSGPKEVCPNGLPVMCIRWDGTLLEHEHADHPDYKHPIDVEYIGDLSIFSWTDDDGVIHEPSEFMLKAETNERHALIYTDGFVAITLYECCYSMWYLPSGNGALKDWKISDESLRLLNEKCKSLREKL